jgi:hypothetical protein
MTKKPVNHGGARKGAGRPRGTSASIVCSFWLGKEARAVLAKVPRGRRSKYVEDAVMRKAADPIAEIDAMIGVIAAQAKPVTRKQAEHFRRLNPHFKLT